ncbi:protein-disulfide reductase DsbD family protein [Gammaproteobacteria bacterium]|nr:protein-disulfide reductase DsbD family protein [Gammaproteobacteria bacterium]MDA9041092.1 protein-disulfide reductase DsbD family protein [Gammaproteobacteria bacterium]
MKIIKLCLLLVTCSNFIFANTVSTGHAEVSIVKSSFSQTAENELIIGIKMDMQLHWHTYWKNPGDSGGPVKISWDMPAGFEIDNILWPAPSLIPYPPLMTYGYENFVIFPIKIQIPKGAETEKFIADIDFLICDDICVPERAIIETSYADLTFDFRLDETYKELPSVILPVISTLKNDYLELRFSFNQNIEEIHFYIDQKDTVLHANEQILIKEENNWLLTVPLNKGIDALDTIEGILNINNESFIVDASLSEASSSSETLSIFSAILFAFIGGLILNLMPCVFPIISLKVLSFISMGGESKNKIRNHSLLFSLGVILSFVAIAIILLVLKNSGLFIGWGFQLQSPLIVATLSILMFMIGLVLLSDINIGSSLTRLGNVGSNKTDYSSSFLTGVLAVIVASPCTAPFMGAAIGYALIQPSFVTLPIFISLGLGFCIPYLMLSVRPELISSLPKPGQWMETLKEFFAFPMFATSLWLIWVFSIQAGADALINLLMSLLMISLLFWVFSKLTTKYIKILIILIGLLITTNQLYSIKNTEISDVVLAKNTSNKLSWNLNIEDTFKENDQAYLINFTAAWCITCQANDKIALSRPSVVDFMESNNIKYVVADWTNRDKEILKVLNTYGRSGVPLYVFWRPGMDESILLPAILTENLVLDIISQ